MIAAPSLAVRVRETAALSPTLKQLVLEPADGGVFPPTQAGAHVLLSLRTPDRTHRNAYSLTHIPTDRAQFGIIVRRAAASRGGSAFVHEAVRAGDTLDMGLPQNLFPIHKLAKAHVLLAAGIGVTPFLAYLPALARARIPARLHQVCRAAEAQVFSGLLADHAAETSLHAGGRPDLRSLLTDLPLGTHLSICGPDGFLADVTQAAHACGFAPGKIHCESFGGAAPGRAFIAVLRDGRRIPVDQDVSLLEALEQSGVDAPSLCRGGVCGQCRVEVRSGLPEHRDHVLSPEERARGNVVMTCVSRATTAELALEI